jgi:hypothetical protein
MATAESNLNAPIPTPSTPSSVVLETESGPFLPHWAIHTSPPEHHSRPLQVPLAFAHLPDFCDVGYILNVSFTIWDSYH